MNRPYVGGGVLAPVVLGRFDYARLRENPHVYIEALLQSTEDAFRRRGAISLCAYVFGRAVPKLAACFPREDIIWFTGPEEVNTRSKGMFQFVLREMTKHMAAEMVVQVSETWVVTAKPGSPEYVAYREWLATHNNDCEGFALAKEQVIVSVETRWGDMFFYENPIRRDVHGNPSLTGWIDKPATHYFGKMMGVFAEALADKPQGESS